MTVNSLRRKREKSCFATKTPHLRKCWAVSTFELLPRQLIFTNCSWYCASDSEANRMFVASGVTQKNFMGFPFSGVLVCVVCDVIIWRRIPVFQTNVLAKFALICHSRQNKDNCFGYKYHFIFLRCVSEPVPSPHGVFWGWGPPKL